MKKESLIGEYIQALKNAPRLGSQVAFHEILPATRAKFAKPKKPWPATVSRILADIDIKKIYSHQAAAVDLIRAGRHVVVATPTASGKTLIYNLPVIEKVLKDESARALYLFPLKALAQDQKKTFTQMAALCEPKKISAAIYDGDTSAWHRKKIRLQPPNVVMTNPEMLHLSFLPYHQTWAELLASLKVVVVDEVHTYRGVMGSHMAHIFRRLLRICSFYGSAPLFLFSSATVANPAQLAQELTGLEVETVAKSGAPQGRRHVVFMESIDSPARTAILLLKAALHRGLRTIVYTQSRKMAELIAIWAGSQAGEFADRISAYRAGFLPEERRDIEAKLASGELLAVITTSALELGIDIGDLDLCLLVGYPGSVVATWQRSGRVGRSGQDAALILIPGEDALDQYFLRNPEDLMQRAPEAAVINPYNKTILKQHLVCAAAELALDDDEPFLAQPEVHDATQALVASGDLLASADGKQYFARRKSPHRHVNLRGSGDRFNIISSQDGEHRGDIDGFRAFKETHTGAIYLHRGETYLVEELDIAARVARVIKANVGYYTRVRADKDTKILETHASQEVGTTTICVGRLEVTDQVTAYEKWQIHVKRRLNVIPLDLPPLIFETEGLWINIPLALQRKVEGKYLHFMGGIHAIEHAAIGILPLLVMADRNDIGGICMPSHPQLETAAIFIYDGVPGGAGLTRQAYGRATDLLAYTLKAIQSCPCENGCPSCVHSPKCGSGNRPIDKTAAVMILNELLTGAAQTSKPKKVQAYRPDQAPVLTPLPPKKRKTAKKAIPKSKPPAVATRGVHFAVFDLETQRSAQEVGGWHRAERMRVSCGVVYDSKTDQYLTFLEDKVPDLIDHLKRCDLVVGFNVKRFDYRVLSRYSDCDFKTLPTLDLLEKVHDRLGYRLSLNHLAAATLSAEKSADGLQALRWWKEGRIDEIVKYCRMDVELTRDLFLYGQEHEYLLFKNKAGSVVRCPVDW
jgi:DEAD/DEAH box helicase domain-containing protein